MMTKLVFIFIALLVLAIAYRWIRSLTGGHRQSYNRARHMRWRIRFHMRPGPGFASMAELLWSWSRMRQAIQHGRRARPDIGRMRRLFVVAAVDYAIRFGRAQYGRKVYGRMEDQVLIFAPPRIGKTAILGDRILSHPGPCLVTSTRGDLYQYTAELRSKLGPIHVFNPQGVGSLPSTFSWDVVSGCDDAATAMRRAAALTGSIDSAGGSSDMDFWVDKSAAALAALLHAAAFLSESIITVYAWCNRMGDQKAAEVLATHPKASRALASTLGEIAGSGKTADSIRVTMSRALSWVAIPAIARAVTPGPGEGFGIAEFIGDNGTLYMIASDTENSPIAPLFRAFASEVHYIAGLIGSKTSYGKLVPSMFMALDEVTQICPVDLPGWLSDSAGKGILITSVCHSMGQLRERWGEAGANTIWATSGVKVFLGGISDAETLDWVSTLCGSIKIQGEDKLENCRILPPEVLRELADWRALIMRMNLRPVVVKIRPVWKRRDYRHRPHRFSLMPKIAVAPFTMPEKSAAPNGNGNGNGNGSNGQPPSWVRDDEH